MQISIIRAGCAHLGSLVFNEFTKRNVRGKNNQFKFYSMKRSSRKYNNWE